MSEIDGLLRRLADEDARVTAPPRLEPTVMALWDAAHAGGDAGTASAPGPTRRARVLRAALPIAAAIAGIAIAGAYLANERSALPALPAAPAVSLATLRPAAAAIDAAGAVPAPALSGSAPGARRTGAPPARESAMVVLIGEPFSPNEMMRVVRMRAPSAALRVMGLRPVERRPDALVDLDVLVGEDGVARAVRVGM